jgi:hypothetical protein
MRCALGASGRWVMNHGSATATAFLRELQNNANLAGVVYSSTERLDELGAKFKAQNDDRQYTAWVNKPNLLCRVLRV